MEVRDSKIEARTAATPTPKRSFPSSEKYPAIAEWLKRSGASGALLDIGARDRILSTYLDLGKFKYSSADLGGTHDYCLDLEAPLPFPDRAFDYTVCLDVLEHVEKCHFALRELLRITGRHAFIALPNMSTLQRRLSFLVHGSLSTDKYDLKAEHQGDRHRWLTTYGNMEPFILANASKAGFRLVEVLEELVGRRPGRQLTKWGVIRSGLYVERCTFVLERAA